MKYLRFSYDTLLRGNLTYGVCLSPVFDDLFDVAMFDVISGRSLECQGVSCMISGILMISFSFLFCRHKNILKVHLFNFFVSSSMYHQLHNEWVSMSSYECVGCDSALI